MITNSLFRAGVFIATMAVCSHGVATVLAEEQPELALATFVSDVTPPLGHQLQGHLGVKPVVAVDDPLYAHGIVLPGAGEPIVVVSVDWCGIANDAHDRWRGEGRASCLESPHSRQ